MKNKIDKRLLIFKDMPPLYNKFPDQPYSSETSEISRWIKFQPEIIEWVKKLACRKGLIEYDSVSGLWRGVNQK